MAWFYPIAAGLFEIGGPVGLKRSQTPGRRVPGVVGAGAGSGRADGIAPVSPPTPPDMRFSASGG